MSDGRGRETAGARCRAFQTDLPAGFEVVAASRGTLACRTGQRESLEEAGFAVDGRHTGPRADRLEEAQESGREPLGRLRLRGVDCLVRRFTHGGLARLVTGRRFRDPNRPFQELVLSERLRSLEVPTPRVVAARAVKLPFAGYELSLVIERVDGVVDLGIVLGRLRRGELERSRFRAALRSAGEAIGRLHRVGFIHADLQPANLLWRAAEPDVEAIPIDLDGSAFDGAPLADDLRLQNLARLWRHVGRREEEYGAVLHRTDLMRFLGAYGVPRADWAGTMSEIERRSRRRRAIHGLGWFLERSFGRSVDARAAGRAAR